MADSPALSYRKCFAIPAKPAPVFDALTNPLHLKLWFAEHVEVEAQVGGAFRFWGRHTLWVGDPKLADQRVARLDFPRELAFGWTWNGSPSQVSLRVTPAEDGSQVEVQHELASAWDPKRIGEARAEWVADSFWSLAMGNLRHYLAEGEPALLPDLGGDGDELSLALEVPADPAEVYAALTEPRRLDRWIARGARVDLEDGDVYSWGWTVDAGGSPTPVGPRRWIEAREGERLVHDWSWPGEEAESPVRWELEAETFATRLRLAHGVPAELRDAYCVAWASALVALQALLGEGASEA